MKDVVREQLPQPQVELLDELYGAEADAAPAHHPHGRGSDPAR
jgi:hypothetical protein